MYSIVDLTQNLESLKAHYNKRLGEKTALEQQRTDMRKQINNMKVSIADLESVRIVLEDTTNEARKVYSSNMASVVTSALQYTFGPDFRLIVEHKESKGKPEIHFWVEHALGSKIVKQLPQKAMGGGVCDQVAFALQVTTKKLCRKPAQNGPLILDEPAKMISAEFVERFGQFIQYISKEFDMQIIGVTHQQAISRQMDQTFYVEIKNGQSVISTPTTQQLDTLVQGGLINAQSIQKSGTTQAEILPS